MNPDTPTTMSTDRVATVFIQGVALQDVAEQWLEFAARVGVVVDFVLLRQLIEATEENVHRAAVVAGVAEASRWRDVPGPVLGPEWGRRIDLDTFYGSDFDRQGRRLLLHAGDDVSEELQRKGYPGRSAAKFFGPYTWTDSDDVEHALWFGEGETPGGGYASYFAKPPFGTHLDHPGIAHLFLTVINQVLQNPTQDTEIWQWEASSVWAPYFEAGEDWWGTAAWTLRLTDDTLLAIAASTTDYNLSPHGRRFGKHP